MKIVTLYPWKQSDYEFVFYGRKEEEKEKKKTKKISNFLKACILGMANAICFKSGMQSPLTGGHLHKKFGVVQTGDHRSKSGQKITFFPFLLIYLCCVHKSHF